MRFLLFVFISLFNSPICFANEDIRPFQLGVGYAKQRLQADSIKDSSNNPKGKFDFDSIEIRANWFFFRENAVRLGLEAQFHQSVQAQKTISGSIDLQEYVVGGIANWNLWRGFCLEGGVNYSLLARPLDEDRQKDFGIGFIAGASLLFLDSWELRLRREDKVFFHNSIQPGYSATVGYSF